MGRKRTHAYSNEPFDVYEACDLVNVGRYMLQETHPSFVASFVMGRYNSLLLHLKYMDMPTRETLDDFWRLADKEKLEQTESVFFVDEIVNLLSRDRKWIFKGWKDCIALFCILKCARESEDVKRVFASAMDADPNSDKKASLDLFQCKVESRLVDMFFRGLMSKDYDMCADAKMGLSYPPGKRTKEQMNMLRARRAAECEVHDEEF